MNTIEYHVDGMSCGHCEQAVRTEVGRLEGVEHVEVSAASGSLRIVVRTPVADDEVRAAVADAGYDAVRV